MALMTFANFPQIKRIKASLIFVAHSAFVPEEYTRGDESALWAPLKWDIERLNYSAKFNSWPANPTALCRYCPVKSCEFNEA